MTWKRFLDSAKRASSPRSGSCQPSRRSTNLASRHVTISHANSIGVEKSSVIRKLVEIFCGRSQSRLDHRECRHGWLVPYMSIIRRTFMSVLCSEELRFDTCRGLPFPPYLGRAWSPLVEIAKTSAVTVLRTGGDGSPNRLFASLLCNWENPTLGEPNNGQTYPMSAHLIKLLARSVDMHACR